uniref:DEP domain-containing protein n=1 Tax=Paramoeba aestuarina TaxID=180227 RepID=A0A7S4KMY7_9EUKA|eukprot:CAMPEP_0201522784 /NCGR_PEP_ID=MMETSP0161_2-20130828/18550_1 /ASSEMBLY_ACC=CAM_ASM_000251 /TAXON_ID=180227 /ORGANISM="Neoparamoeba aestuarina, Strain SoJaBio B1-5/56/2" /LENGTH=498 /DNA_ID=CAMNT_0047921715 /DNA_START=104 /DNA_END=1600 /DNA_ORIENTATION=+
MADPLEVEVESLAISEGANWKGAVHVFTISGCPFCRRSKAYLTEKGIPYNEVDLSNGLKKHKFLIERTKCYTVPQIFFNDTFIGGCDDLKGKSQDELNELVELVKNNPIKEPEFFIIQDDQPKEEEKGFEFICEPDPLRKIATAMKKEQTGVGVKNRTWHLKTYKRVFVGQKAVLWLIENGHAKTIEEALNLGNEMMENHIFHHVTYDHSFKNEELFYRFLEDDKTKSLNTTEEGIVSICEPLEPGSLAGGMRKMILQLYDAHLSADGLKVNYKGIKNDPLFAQYKQLAAELQRIRLEDMTVNGKIAFFINIYNSLVIHANVVKGFPTTSWQRWRFFNKMSYRIGGHVLTLNDIESGILRGNKPPPYSWGAPFSNNDPRRPIALEQGEPRIHFALVCGAKSCPPIKLYDEENLDEQLTSSTQAFLNGDAMILDMNKKEISLTKIMDWYRSDFGKTDERIVMWALSFLDEEKKKNVETLLEGGCKVTFQNYDWNPNSTD